MKSLFRRSEPSAEEVAAFHRDGYIAYPDIMTDQGRQGLIEDMTQWDQARRFLALSEQERQAADNPDVFFVRPWDQRGPWADRLIDDEFIIALLDATIGPHYHFCHSAMNVARRGAGAGQLHQDHHHWNHGHPVNLDQRDKYYIQILYYPNGFKRGDRNLAVVPGSHKVAPLEMTPERLLSGQCDAEAGRKLERLELELPPGSMVYINARMYHGIAAKPVDSPQPYRLFAIDIFKEAGPPHRYTQEIPAEWLAQATPHRRMLFERPPYVEGCWD
ncbi:MAG: hypothetical protein GKR89_24925 [Candidatus Latescibacteria bacterium]|nr:hypothetical protein [Candidatus Latescibacterota bacterium]